MTARPVALLRLDAIQRAEDLEDEIEGGVSTERGREINAALDRCAEIFRPRDERTAAFLAHASSVAQEGPRQGERNTGRPPTKTEGDRPATGQPRAPNEVVKK